MAHLQNTPSNFDELEEGEIREDEEIDFLIKLEETCQERLKKLLSIQESELKKFKIFKQAREMEFEMNCWKFPKFEILKKGFEKHMKAQYRNFIAMQIEARNKDRILKENWMEMAKNGKFEMAFFETPIPNSKFRMERFDYESEMRNLQNESTQIDSNFESLNLEKSNPNPNLINQTLDESDSNPNLENKEDNGNKDKMECDYTTLDTTNPNLNPKPNLSPNSPVSVMPNPNSKSEKTLEDNEMVTCNFTTLSIPDPNSSQITTQNPNLQNEVILLQEDEIIMEENNPNSPFVPLKEHSNNSNWTNEEITTITSNSTPNISNISQINPPNQVVVPSFSNQNHSPPVQQQFATSPSSNQNHSPPVQEPFATSYSSNENVPPVQEPLATSSSKESMPPVQELFLGGDIEMARELFRMIPPQLQYEDPILNEMLLLEKLLEVKAQKRDQKVARLKADIKMELEQVGKRYGQVDAELENEYSKAKLPLKKRYETVLRNDRLAHEFHDIYHNATLPVPSSGSSRPAAQTATEMTATPNRGPSSSSSVVQTPVSLVSVATPNPASNPELQTSVFHPAQNRNSDSQTVTSQVTNRNSDSRTICGIVPNQNSESRLSANRSVGEILRAPPPHMRRYRPRPQNG